MSLANTKARLRMTTLYAYAQNYSYLVVGTDNACEWYTGYFTKYGDGGVDLVPLLYLTKTQVYEMAQALKLPQFVIDKAPTAGLIDGVNDEDEMGFSYKDLETYMAGGIVDDEIVTKINKLHTSSQHKRELALKPDKKACDF
jgi:NAD+ synthase